MTSVWSLHTARCSGVQPSSSFTFTSNSFSSSNSATAVQLLYAASCSAVRPISFLASIVTPRASIWPTTLTSSRLAAEMNLAVSRALISSYKNKWIEINTINSVFETIFNILLIFETKTDLSVPSSQLKIEGFSSPFRLGRNSSGGGIMLIIRNSLSAESLKGLYLNPYGFYLVMLPLGFRRALIKYLIKPLIITKTQGFRQELYEYDLLLYS